MDLANTLLIAAGLSADAFAASVCKGLAIGKARLRDGFIAGMWFGAFQGLMPLIGYFAGSRFQKYIEAVDHWVALLLLGLIGLNMIREAFFASEEKVCSSLRPKEMIAPALATSVDALVVGIAMAMAEGSEGLNIFASVGLIAFITFALCTFGVKLGGVIGSKYKRPAEAAGGVILILIGVKTVLEHTGIINF